MTFKASLGSIFAATAATLPSAMATSRTALVPFFGSMRWPPCRRTSYFGGSAVRPTRGRRARTRAMRQGVFVIASGPGRAVAGGRPLRPQVLPHLQRAREGVAGDRAREGVVQGVAVGLVPGARDAHLRAIHAAGEVAGHEVALVRALEGVALLPQEEAMGGP